MHIPLMGLPVLPPNWTCVVGLLPVLPEQPALPCFQCPGPDCTELAGGVAAEPHRERLPPDFAAAMTHPCSDNNAMSAS